MKKKLIIVMIAMILMIGIVITLPKKKYSYEDENTLYYIEFDKNVYRFERYDYSLGQNQIVGVEMSTDKGKTFHKVTNEPIIVSMEPKFVFLNEQLGFAIARPNITKSNEYMGVKVTNDSGQTFIDAKINYNNPDIDMITIEEVPYYEKDTLTLKGSIYKLKDDDSGYEDVEIIFTSNDNGLTWNVKNNDELTYSRRKKNLITLIKNEMMNNGYIDKDNLNSFEIVRIYVYGYHKLSENKKNMQITFKVDCKDNTQKCINHVQYYDEEDVYYTWILTDEKNIFEFQDGISLSKYDIESGNYVRVGEEIQ